MRTDRTDAPADCEYATVYVVFELSKAKWQLGIMLPGAERMSRYRIDGGDIVALSGQLLRARAKAEQQGKLVRSPGIGTFPDYACAPSGPRTAHQFFSR